MKIELFNYRLRLECSLSKTVVVEGINSNLDEAGNFHILLWDFDEPSWEAITKNLRFLQHFCKLPTIYIIESSPEHYHAYCLAKKSKAETLYILASTPDICQTYFKLGVVRGFWTLRITSKNKSDQFHCIVKLPSSEPECFKDLDELETVQYKTGVR